MENESTLSSFPQNPTAKPNNQAAYLDWISASPVLPEAQTAVMSALNEHFGNPSSRLHGWGVRSQRAMDKARGAVAELIGAWDPVELIFCGSASEANNLAIKGIAKASERGKHIVISAVDHPSVRMAAERLQWEGYSVSYAPVDECGRVSVGSLKELLRNDTAIVSVQHANTEIGTIQPVAEIAALCNEREIPFHSDGWGAVGFLPVNVGTLGVSAYTIGSNGFWGPPGAAALWLKKGTDLFPQIDGGAQEMKRRAGTENLPAIIGMGVAAEIAKRDNTNRAEKLKKLSSRIYDGLQKGFQDCNPTRFFPTGHSTERLPHIASFRFEWVEGEALLLGNGADSIAAISGSACARPELGASYVLEACGVSEEQCSGGITLSVGWSTTSDQIDYAVSRIIHHGKRLFEMSHMTG